MSANVSDAALGYITKTSTSSNALSLSGRRKSNIDSDRALYRGAPILFDSTAVEGNGAPPRIEPLYWARTIYTPLSR